MQFLCQTWRWAHDPSKLLFCLEFEGFQTGKSQQLTFSLAMHRRPFVKWHHLSAIDQYQTQIFQECTNSGPSLT